MQSNDILVDFQYPKNESTVKVFRSEEEGFAVGREILPSYYFLLGLILVWGSDYYFPHLKMLLLNETRFFLKSSDPQN